MKAFKRKRVLLVITCLMVLLKPLNAQTGSGIISLQDLLRNMESNYELLKYQGSLVKASQASKKAVSYDRLPHLNTMLQATVNSVNNQEGAYQSYGFVPSIVGSATAQSNLAAVAGDAAFAGLNWEAVNFGGYKANENLAKSNLLVQMNTLASTQYDVDGYAAAFYIELIRQYQLQTVEQDNVARLQQLKTIIGALVNSGVRPGVDSSVASAELSKSVIALYQVQKTLAQTKVQLSTLTGFTTPQLNADTAAVTKVNTDGENFVFNAVADTVHHPYIELYSSMYNRSKAQLKLNNNSYYPKVFVDADAWARGSSLSSAGVYNTDLLQGYQPGRFNYLVGLTLTYDIFNIAHKRLNASIYKYEMDAAYHQLQNEKINLNSDVQQALLEKDFEFNRLVETKHQLDQATSAYNGQLSLYKNGLSSVIELSTALEYYIQAQKDYVEANIGLMKSIINYSLVTNTFTALVQTLKL